MNTASNSILSPSFAQTLDAAASLYQKVRAEKEAARAKEELAFRQALENERKEVYAWLEAKTQIPPELLPYIDLSEYTHKQAERVLTYHDAAGYEGFPARLEIPGAAPIRFNIVRRNEQFGFFTVNNEEGTPMMYNCPFFVSRYDDDGYIDDPDLAWSFRPGFNHNNFMMALGNAVALWQEMAEPLLRKIQEEKERATPINEAELALNEAEEHMNTQSLLAQSPEEMAYWLDGLIEGCRNKALLNKRHKLDTKLFKFVDILVASGNEDLAFEFNTLIHNELSAIIRACFLAGLAYGLTPHPNLFIEDRIGDAVMPIEAGTFQEWMVIEMRLRQLGDTMAAKYTKLDLLIARHKGLEQEAAFLHGIEIGKHLTQAVSHREEI